MKIGLKVINEDLMYKVLSIPTFVEKEERMIEFLLGYAKEKGMYSGIDMNGNVYITKGMPPEGEFYPCVTAHMDTVHWQQITYVDHNVPIPLMTQQVNGKHLIRSKEFGFGGDDKCGIVIALTILEQIPVCKAVFFVEEEDGCSGSRRTELKWFSDVGYIIGFDSPEGNCASWALEGSYLFDRAFYESYLEELGEKFGLTKYASHPYTDVSVLRMDTALACMNFGAGYYEYHTPSEYCIAEEMDNAAAMGIYLIGRLGYNEYLIPYVPNPTKDDENYAYFSVKFLNH